MELLSKPTTNYKANKNIDLGYHTYFLSLAHSDISGYSWSNNISRMEVIQLA